MMTYEIWDQTSGNCVGDFYDEGDALDVAGDIIAKDARPDGYALVSLDDEGNIVRSLTGSALERAALSPRYAVAGR
jgi:hypothetical protein